MAVPNTDTSRLSPASAVPVGTAVAATIGALIMLIVPLPAIVVDLLLAASLAGATGLLLVAIVTPRPVKLSTLPSIVVLSSLARLLLAITVARLIVTSGQAGLLTMTLADVAGFHNPVASLGSLITLAVVQFVVVTAGVTRIAEVAARFALDALPGKQLMLETQARTKSDNAVETDTAVAHLEREANFYGAMDGAARFLRGETIAVVAIVVLTPLVRLASAGFGGQRWEVMALTVAGHGLIIIVPALLVGAATAIMIARASTISDLAAEAQQQFFGTPVAVVGVALACLLLALVPGVAKLPLLAIAVGLGIWGWFIARQPSSPPAQPATQSKPAADNSVLVRTAPQLHLGWGLIELVDDNGQPLLNQLMQIRQELSERLGFALPAFVVKDSEKLEIDQYSLVFRGSTLGTGRLRPARRLAIASRPALLPEEGILVKLPEGRYGKWIRADREVQIPEQEVKILLPIEVLGDHLRWLVRNNADAFFDTERASELITQLEQSHPATVAQAHSAGLTASKLATVGSELLVSGIVLTDSVTLVEALTTALARQASPGELVEAARRALAPVITETVAPDGSMYAVTLAPALEEKLEAASRDQPTAKPVLLSPDAAQRWRDLLEALTARHRRADRPLVLLVNARIRLMLSDLASALVPELVVLEPDEVLPSTDVVNIHTINAEQLNKALE